MSWDISNYSTNPDLNTLINGHFIGEGSDAADYDDALRQMMADIAAWTATYAISYPISLAHGGTGQTTAGPAFNAIAAAGGTIGGDLKRSGKGNYPYYGSTSMTGGQIFVQAIGADPMSSPGDIVFEY
jgi:hypothetical protein